MRLYGDPILRKTASPVRHFDEALAELAENMILTMYHHSGIGLAGPQIGLGKRIFVAAEVAEPAEEAAAQGEAGEPETAEEKRESWGVVREHVLVNPELIWSEGVQHGVDGCLSVPGLYVDEMERAARVRLRYQDLAGEVRELEAEGRFAHVLQHELDHLDGVFFFDRLSEPARRAFLNEHRAELAQIQRDAKVLLREHGGAPVAAIR